MISAQLLLSPSRNAPTSRRFQDEIIPRLGNVDLEYISVILSNLLGMEYVLYGKTQNFHWNVTGQSFVGIHKLLGKQYHELSGFIDQVAEQIRKYGRAAPGSLQEFLILNDKVQGIQEKSGELIRQELIAAEMVSSHEVVIQNINGLQNSRIDLATQNMLGDILHFHMKAAWMWRAHLE